MNKIHSNINEEILFKGKSKEGDEFSQRFGIRITNQNLRVSSSNLKCSLLYATWIAV